MERQKIVAKNLKSKLKKGTDVKKSKQYIYIGSVPNNSL